eukprot:gene15254-16828_t
MRLRDRKTKATTGEEEESNPLLDIEMKDDDDSTLKISDGEGHNSHHHHHNYDGEHSRGLDGDKYNVMLLLLLYVLQGIPLGLAGSMPMVLQNKGISYKQQAMFSLVFWPFSLKLLWAPMVDSVYVKSIGRRKTWLVPTQFLIGFFMLTLSMKIDDFIETEMPQVFTLTCIFFLLNFLAATQDVAVDGWALTMLSRHNVGYASTCNSVGQTAGYFLGNVVFLALNSADFCNAYLRSGPSKTGVVTLAGFLWFWGIVFLVTTSLVMIFKKEKQRQHIHSDDNDDGGEELGIVQTYLVLVKIVKLPAVLEFAIVLLTSRVGFAATDSVTGLKLVEAGVPKETLAMLAVPLVPIQIILPWIISKYTAGPRPLDMYKKAIPFRLCFGLLFALLVNWTHHVRPAGTESFPFYYYLTILSAYGIHQVTVYTMFVSIMAFHAKISDPLIGGTYMTLLNTVSNLGGVWPSSLSLWAVDGLTWKSCTGVAGPEMFCNTAEETKVCNAAGGSCSITVDGYYIETVICVVLASGYGKDCEWMTRCNSLDKKQLGEPAKNRWTSNSLMNQKKFVGPVTTW